MPTLLDTIGATVPDVFKLAVALGQVPNYEAFRKFGMNDLIASGTQDMWPNASVRTNPTSAGVCTVQSSDIADDGDPAGTGAWTLTVQGLDENYLEVAETVTLNGTSGVATTQTFLRINRAFVNTAGTNESNVGTISGTVGGNAQFYIEPNEGQTHQVLYTVPANKILAVDTYSIGVGRMSGSTDIDVLGQIRLNAGENDEAWRSISDIYLWNGGSHTNDSSVTIIPAKTDIRMRVVSTTATQAYGIVGGYLIKVA